MPKVSVIIPVYNTELYLNKCIESVISQTYKNLEIILVDDGSTDKSVEICDEYARKDNRIKVIHQKNGGQALARNTAMKYVNGDYIVYIDSDDVVDIEHIDYLLLIANKYNADIIQCEMCKFRTERQLAVLQQKNSAVVDFGEEVFSSRDALIQFSYQKKFTPSPWNKLIRREIMDKFKFPVGVGYEDMAIMYKVIGAAEKLVYSSKVSYYYRQHNNSTMHTKFSDRKIDRIRIAQQFLNYMKNMYPENYISAYSRFDLAQLQLLMEMPFENKYKDIKKETYSNLKRTRKIVIHDKEAPYGLKCMVLTSYFGPTVLMILGKVYMKVTKR